MITHAENFIGREQRAESREQGTNDKAEPQCAMRNAFKLIIRRESIDPRGLGTQLV